MLLPVPWTGHTIIEEKCDEFEGHLTYLTQSEELLIKKSCEKSCRGAESKLVQPRILAMKIGPHGKKHRTFQEEEGFIFERLLSDTWSLWNCDVSLLILLLSILLTCVVGLVFLSKNLQKARNVCKPLINYVCSVILEQLKKKKLIFLGAPRPVWTLNLTNVRKVQAMVKLGVMESRISLDKREVVGETVFRKPGFVFVPPSVVEQNVKRKPEMNLEELRETASLEQVTNSMHKLKQQDVCDMEVDLAEVKWQESDAPVWNTLNWKQ